MTKSTGKEPGKAGEDLLAGRKPRRIPAASVTKKESTAPAGRSDGPRRSYSPAGPRSDGPRSDGPRRSYSPAGRSDGPRSDGPRRSYAPANRDDRPRRSYVPADDAVVDAIPVDGAVEAAPAEVRTMPEGWLEGRNPVLEALRAGRTINKMWVLRHKGNRPDPVLGRLVAMAREAGVVILEVERDALDRMAFSKGHQGVIAQAAAHTYADWQEVVAAARERGEEPLVLVLDELKDPYNLGSILRIADAAGVHAVVIPSRNSVGLDALTAKASSGAIEYVPVSRVVNIVSTLEAMKKDGFWIVGTDASGDTPYDKADFSGPTAIVVGSEGDGLGRLVREHCDFLVGIPMCGKVNSLNVAVATGVVVFEALRRRTATAAE